MTYIRTGTIAANNGSQVITGTGTRFITDQVLVGDAIYIGDDGTPYDVTSVNSQTSIGIAIPYRGVTGSGKSYVVMPVQGHNHDLAMQARELLRYYRDGVTGPQGDKGDKGDTGPQGPAVPIKQTTGQSTTDAMSQKAVTDMSSIEPAAGKIPLANGKGKISPDWFVVDQLRASVEAASGGRTTVIYTNEGNPSYMHILPAFNCEDVAPGGELGTGTHPAFMFNGVRASEIFVGAHLGGMMGSQVVSHPGLDPRASISFDQARALCKANGPGWDMMSNLDWAAIALWCMANGYQPRGNTNYGRSHENRWETGRRQDGGEPGNTTGTARTLTGSGPAAWAHDGTDSGIHDLVGNVWEWVTGMKLVNGRAWIAPDNGQTEEAQLIDSDFDMINANPWSSHTSVGASDLVKQSLLAPASPALSPVGRLYVNAEGERIPCRGGSWLNAGNAGLGALNLDSVRASANTAIGFRPRFRNP